jgi:uncharacterized protein
MSASDPLKEAHSSEEQRAYEPSMEEILASIRRIISDDQSLPVQTAVRQSEASLRAALENTETAPRPSVTPVAPPAAEAAVPKKPEESASSYDSSAAEPPPAPRIVATSATLGQVSPQPCSVSDPSLRGVAQPKQTAREEAALLRFAAPIERREEAQAASLDEPMHAAPQSPPAAAGLNLPHKEPAAVTNLFSSSTDQTVTAAFNTLAASRLVENDEALRSLASEMIRPLLKVWLDENLPGLVERLVRAEIERVARGGR